MLNNHSCGFFGANGSVKSIIVKNEATIAFEISMNLYFCFQTTTTKIGKNIRSEALTYKEIAKRSVEKSNLLLSNR